MSKWYAHDEHAFIADAVRDYRNTLDADQPTNMAAGDPRLKECADAGELLADRVQMALRSTDWRRVEASAAERLEADRVRREATKQHF